MKTPTCTTNLYVFIDGGEKLLAFRLRNEGVCGGMPVGCLFSEKFGKLPSNVRLIN